MRFTTLSLFAVGFYCATFVAEKVMLRGRRVKTAANLDRGSLAVYDATGALSIPAGVALGFTEYGRVGAGEPYVAACGVVMLVSGTALRWAAIRALWRYFTLSVSILEGQRVIRRGLYRVVRHPSYTGLLLRYLGLGFAFANWLSAALVFLPLLCATLYRIRVEEAALREHFGEEYATYARDTKRLVPGVF
jgi:protein-S-isoprenylcysteine O-methyltransferase Ste14